MNAPQRPAKRGTARRSFTLAELLVVVAIISLLASTVVFAMWGAIEEARAARTRAQIARINDLLMTRWDSYQTRIVRMNLPRGVAALPEPFTDASGNTNGVWNPNTPNGIWDPGEAFQDVNQNGGYDLGIAWARLNVLRDLIRMEMPDCKKDVIDGPTNILVVWRQNGNHTYVQTNRPTLSGEYYRRAQANPGWTEQYENSECLYLILSSIRDQDSTGLDFLQAGEIGDLDGDGMPEILDAWGNPIAFLRWPAGFVAHPGKDYEFGTNANDDIPSPSTIQVADPTASHDGFDPMKVIQRLPAPMLDQDGQDQAEKYQFDFALFPLVVSGGPDGLIELVRYDYDPDGDVSVIIPFDYYRSGGNPYGPLRNDPYSVMPTSKRRLGEPFLDSYGYADNIHNHALGDR